LCDLLTRTRELSPAMAVDSIISSAANARKSSMTIDHSHLRLHLSRK
jgi:hypothetical protein